ncbi:kinesin-like protein KIF20B isoform X2 [Clytia hemisphaerica]|uniref:Kinesin motor domain-containing protein n=1 Tax=Clytia hemisphaerica TaxID=252671 RepID=A0A7M5WSS8_9CNID
MEKDNLSKNLFETFEKVNDDEKDKNFAKPAPIQPAKKEPMQVVLRIKPFTDKDLNQKENRGCVVLKENGKVELRAPQDSFQFKSSIRGLADQTHEFSFSRVFDQKTQQKELFDEIMLPFAKDILDGQNGLVFTYGVTNSGKTYTIQGNPNDGGVLPRALDVIFNSISKKLYTRPNLKPKHCQSVVSLTEDEEQIEELVRKSVLSAGQEKENLKLSKLLNSTSKSGCGSASSSANSTILSNISMISSSKQSAIDEAELAEEIRARVMDATEISVEQQGNVKFGVWVSFMEIYNELIYDLLDLTPIGKGRKRPALKLGDDRNGKPYVKGLKTIFVTSSDEAYKVLRLGQNNRHMAATKLNQQSSRSHCIFDIKLLKIVDVGQPHVARISRLSIVDLAGSERYCKTGAEGDLLKQAGNINASIMTLGKCISTLRYNQEHPNHQTIIPFRESKLTRLFQNFFLGKGKASMIVNISQCASVFDETYHVLKFSAVAKQIKMKAERATEFWKAPIMPKTPAATPSNKRPPLTIVTPATSKKRTLENPAEFSFNELVNIVSELRDKVKKERVEKANLERNIRKEVCQEMNELMVEIESSHSEQMMEQKQHLESMMDQRINLLTKVVNKRKRKAEDSIETSAEISLACLNAEKVKVKERDETILTLQSKVRQLEAEHTFLKRPETPEDRHKQLDALTDDLKQTKETVALQNEDIERMQNLLQNKDDEIDKLREALDEEEEGDTNTMKELQVLLETTIKELDSARIKLDNRDIRIKELEKIIESQKEDNLEVVKMAEKANEWHTLQKEKNETLKKTNTEQQSRIEELENEVKSLEKRLQEKSEMYEEADENLKTVQFENDEISIKLETYKTAMQEHQTALNDNETFIEQLNKEVAELNDKLKSFENSESVAAAAEDEKIVVKEEPKNESVKLKEDLVKAELKVQEYGDKITRLEKQMHCYESAQEKPTPVKSAVMKLNPSVSKTPDHKMPASPFKQTPVSKIANTPNKGSPYSPASKVSHQQTIKKLNKLLEETSKALEKKTALVVTKNNRVTQLEAQVSSLEKKTAIKDLKAEKSGLESQVSKLEQENVELSDVKNKLESKLSSEEENTASLNEEIDSLESKIEQLQSDLNQAVKEKEIAGRRHEDEMRHHCVLLNQANESSESSSRRIDELGEQVNKADTLIGELRTSLEKQQTQLQTEQQKWRSELSQKTLELKEAQTKMEDDRKTIKELTNDKERVKNSTNKLQKQLDDRRKSRVCLNTQFSTTLEGYEQRLKDVHDQVDDLEEEKSLCKQKIQELESEIEKLQREPSELASLKTREMEFLQQIHTLEETCSKHEIESQTYSLKNTKLEMRIQALESEQNGTSEKLIEMEKENKSLSDIVRELSEKLKAACVEKINLEQAKLNLEIESEKQFKSILSLEKQKSETDAILDSYKENVNALDEKKKEMSSLEKTLADKDQSIQELRMKINEQEASDKSHSDLLKENIELKESLKFAENEKDRILEEKKTALDELLKLSVKSDHHASVTRSSSRKRITSAPVLEHAVDDYTPKRSKRNVEEKPVTRRLTRSARKCKVVVEPVDVANVSHHEENKENEPVNQSMDNTSVLNDTKGKRRKRLLKKQTLYMDSPSVDDKNNKSSDEIKDVHTSVLRRSARNKRKT